MGCIGVWDRVRAMVWFGALVRVWIWNQGARAVKCKSDITKPLIGEWISKKTVCYTWYRSMVQHLMDDVHLSTARHFQLSLQKFSAAIWSAGGVLRITRICQTRKRCKRPDRVQNERLEDIPGSFKYHGFLKHTFRQTFAFPPIKRSNQCFGLSIIKTTVALASALITLRWHLISLMMKIRETRFSEWKMYFFTMTSC